MFNNVRLHLVSRMQYLVPPLFLLALALQVLDLHSTLVASVGHHEANKVINWLAVQVGFTEAVVAIKVIDVAVLYWLYRAWQLFAKGTHDFEFVLCFTIINTIYSVIVINNYLS